MFRCMICGKDATHDNLLTCESAECFAALRTRPLHALERLKMDRILEKWRRDKIHDLERSGVFIHMTPRGHLPGEE